MVLNAAWLKYKADDSSYALFASACKRAGARNIVAELLDPLRIATDLAPDVRAARTGFHSRPFYSAVELARLWPLICIAVGAKKRASKPTPATLHKRLVESGLPRLQRWDGSTMFLHHGKPAEFFIVQDVWRTAAMRFSQTDFDRIVAP
jgi:hypothetical protein